MHSAGQTAMQAGASENPTHSVQDPASMTYTSSPAEIALTGHSGSQAPQYVHSSVMKSAILIPRLKVVKKRHKERFG